VTIRAPFFTIKQQQIRLWDFQFPNVALQAFSQLSVQPIGETSIDSRPVALPRQHPILFPNLLLIQPPIIRIIFERPAAQIRQQDFLFPNLLTIQPVAGGPVVNEIYDRPAPTTRVQDLLPPNISVLAAAQTQVAPVGQVQTESRPTPPHSQDFPFPNLLTIQPAAGAPFTNQYFDRPAPVIRTQDVTFPNLVINVAVIQAPIVSAIFEKPQQVGRPQDVLPPNIPTLAAAQAQVNPVGSQSQDSRPQVPAARVDFSFPNLLTNTLAAVGTPVLPNLFLFTDRPAAQPRSQDQALPNILVTLLQTVQGTPIVPPYYLLNDRPSRRTPPSDQAPTNGLVLQPAPPPSTELHQNPFFVTMGRLSQLGNLPS
jgi:hypothetical protein